MSEKFKAVVIDNQNEKFSKEDSITTWEKLNTLDC